MTANRRWSRSTRHAGRGRHLGGRAGAGQTDPRIRQAAAGGDQGQARRRPRHRDRDLPRLHPSARRSSTTRERNLGYASVKAPIAGVATQVAQIELGRVAPAGQPVFAIVADKGLWVDGNPKESDLTYVKVGLPATVADRHVSRAASGKGRSARSRRAPARNSRSCRRRTRAATGSKSCSASRCASASTPARTRAACAPA